MYDVYNLLLNELDIHEQHTIRPLQKPRRTRGTPTCCSPYTSTSTVWRRADAATEVSRRRRRAVISGLHRNRK